MRTRLVVGAALVGAVLLGAGGCADAPVSSVPSPGGPAISSSPPGAVERPGPDDVAFVTMMQPHHDQGLQLAGLAATRSADPAVRTLASRIDRAHVEEIGQLEGLLGSWGLPRRVAGPTMADPMGMASGAEVADLGTRRGADFDRRWLAIMIRHHDGAIAAARTVLGTPSSASVRTLAENIVAVQQEQVIEMRRVGVPG